MSLPRKNSDSTVRGKLNESDSIAQQAAHQHFTRAPLLKEVPPQGVVLATVSGTHYIYTNIGGKLLKVAFTAA